MMDEKLYPTSGATSKAYKMKMVTVTNFSAALAALRSLFFLRRLCYFPLPGGTWSELMLGQ